MKEHKEYIPGTCNIGKEEVRVRKNTAVVFGTISLVIAVLLIIFEADQMWRLSIFIPLMVCAVGAIQWYNRFCVYYGFKGLFNFENLGTSTNVLEHELRKQDMAKARKIVLFAFLISVAITILFYFLPF